MGSTTVTDISANYNISLTNDPNFSEALTSMPDSIVFWAKYTAASNQEARIHAITHDAFDVHDPIDAASSPHVISTAAYNFSPNTAWVRHSVPFTSFIQPPLPLLPGGEFFENYANALFKGGKEGYGSNEPVINMLINSAIMALGITFGKLTISLLSAFAIVYFRFPFRKTCFWLIFITLMLPVEVRIVPTYEVVANLNLLNSYSGLIFPLIPSGSSP